MSRLPLILLAFLSAAAAHARQPLTLDQVDATTGAELSFGLFKPSEGEGHARRTGVLLQFGSQRVNGDRAGGYVLLNLSTLDTGDEDFSGPTGVEIGGVYAFDLADDHVLRTRLGMTLPSGGGLMQLFAGAAAAPTRLTDLVLFAPEVGALRVAVSPAGRAGAFVYQIDAGVDLPLLGDIGADMDPLLRLNAMAGVTFGVATVMAELNNLAQLGEGFDEMVHFGALAARFEVGPIKPGVSVGRPIDSDIEDAGFIGQISVAGTLP